VQLHKSIARQYLNIAGSGPKSEVKQTPTSDTQKRKNSKKNQKANAKRTTQTSKENQTQKTQTKKWQAPSARARPIQRLAGLPPSDPVHSVGKVAEYEYVLQEKWRP
jgi:hypothetical protein